MVGSIVRFETWLEVGLAYRYWVRHLRPSLPMDGEVEPTGTKLQEHVLNCEAARRAKYTDVFCTYSRRPEEGRTQ